MTPPDPSRRPLTEREQHQRLAQHIKTLKSTVKALEATTNSLILHRKKKLATGPR